MITNTPLPFDISPTHGQEDECVENDTVESADPKALSSTTEKQLVAALLKLEYLVHLPGTSIDEFYMSLVF